MTYSNKFYTNYLEETRRTFDNLSLYPDFTEAVAVNGYPQTRLQQGNDFHTTLDTVIHAYLDKRQSARTKAKEMLAKFEEVSKLYRSHVNRLKEEFAFDREMLNQLGLLIPMDRTRSGFIIQAIAFYNKAISNSNVFTKLQAVGFSLESLERDRRGVEEYRDLRSEYGSLSGECQELVTGREKAYRALKGWMNGFIAACKFVFADNLQALEKVGIFVLNEPRRTKTVEPVVEPDGSTES